MRAARAALPAPARPAAHSKSKASSSTRTRSRAAQCARPAPGVSRACVTRRIADCVRHHRSRRSSQNAEATADTLPEHDNVPAVAPHHKPASAAPVPRRLAPASETVIHKYMHTHSPLAATSSCDLLPTSAQAIRLKAPWTATAHGRDTRRRRPHASSPRTESKVLMAVDMSEWRAATSSTAHGRTQGRDGARVGGSWQARACMRAASAAAA